MYKNILVPLDESRRAEAILPHVEKLARCFEARVIFLSVIEPIKIMANEGGYIPDITTILQNQKEIKVKTERYLKGINGVFREKGIAGKTVTMEGPIVNSIIDVAVRENADLVAMSSHGRTGLSHVFYGSVAAGVLHRIDRPLLLIRENGK
jgi:nucleotide-binding universal stress UspA family protein